MALLFYNLFLRLYRAGIAMAALSNTKAKDWLQGRKDWRNTLRLKTAILREGKRIWIHAASLGEFEQARPLIEELKERHPKCLIFLTFFSPSGYQVQKNYKLADVVCYLPLDGKKPVADFLEILRPDVALFVKYEFWYHYLAALHTHNVPTFLLSGVFRKEQPFFKWYGGLFRKMLGFYTTLFVQDNKSKTLLQSLPGIQEVVVTGDTRYDRVLAIASHPKQYSILDHFMANEQAVIAGSTWPDDEDILVACLAKLPKDIRLLLAPHEIGEAHLQAIEQKFEGLTLRYTHYNTEKKYENKRVLIIDTIGMLSSLYRYGVLAFVGGGFSKSGIHNVLEPAVYGLPIFTGPHYRKFAEAVTLKEEGYLQVVANAEQCGSLMNSMLADQERLQQVGKNMVQHVKAQSGATKIVMSYLEPYLNKDRNVNLGSPLD